jgi:hypothetical protein
MDLAVKSGFDAGDSAMLTFLLDKQDSVRHWPAGQGRSVGVHPSKQCDCFSRSCFGRKESSHEKRHRVIEHLIHRLDGPSRRLATGFVSVSTGSSFLAQLLLLNGRRQRQRSLQRSKSLPCRFRSLHRPLRFAHCVRKRTPESSLKRTPPRSHA